MREDRAGDAVQVLRARGQERPSFLKGGWGAVGCCEGEEVVHGEGIDLAAVGAAVFDFGAADGFVAAVRESNPLSKHGRV